MKNDRTREEDEEEKGWLKRNAANDSRASSPPRINPPVIQYQISESSEELTYSSPRVLSGRIERYTRAKRERGGGGGRRRRGDGLSKARGALPDIPEINNYDSAHRHYALNIVEAASKT